MNHVTQAKRLLKALLLAELPAQLQRGDAEAGDGIVTPPPYEAHTTDKLELGGYPAVELIAQSSRPTADSYAQVYEHRVAIGFTLAGDDEEALTVRVERYMWAVRQVALGTQQRPDNPLGVVTTGGEQYSPLDRRTSAGVELPFVKGGWLEVLFTTVE